MFYGDVFCERVMPFQPEAYACTWADRNNLAKALLRDNKGSRTRFRPGIKDAPGILGKDHAYVEVER